jgi:hypothetical protein
MLIWIKTGIKLSEVRDCPVLLAPKAQLERQAQLARKAQSVRKGLPDSPAHRHFPKLGQLFSLGLRVDSRCSFSMVALRLRAR